MVEKLKRGFAVMTPERCREAARKGGAAVPPEKRAFSTDPLLAAKAGKKGGLASDQEKRPFYRNRELAVDAGNKGRAAKAEKLNRLID